jgi:uncharacterized membrane protein YkvI
MREINTEYKTLRLQIIEAVIAFLILCATIGGLFALAAEVGEARRKTNQERCLVLIKQG